MLSIAMYVCETPEEAASVAAVISATSQPGEGVTLVTSDPEGQHLICDLRSTTSTPSANAAIATSLVTLLSTALDLLTDTEPSSSLH